MVKLLNIYFVHTQDLKERKSVISNFTNFFKKYKFKDIRLCKVEIISDFDVKDISVDIIKQYVNYEKISENHVEFYNQFLRNIHINQLSNSLKHYKAIETIVRQSNKDELNLILEDDILYEERVCASFENMINSLPSSYDIIFTGYPTVTEVRDVKQYTFEDTKKIFRTLPFCDSYLISYQAAQAIANNYIPIKFSNNIQISYVSEKIGLSTQQCVPNIFIDGSKYGMYLSKLSPNNPLIFNDDYTKLRALVNKEVLSNDDKHEIETLLEKTPLKNNPDLIQLECLYHIKNNSFDKAKQRYDFAYNIYVSNGCILSNESVFLKDYIRVHKYLQHDLSSI